MTNRSVPNAVHAHQHHEISLPWLSISPAWRNFRRICNSHIFTSSKVDARQHQRRQKVEQLINYVQDSCREGKPVNIGQAAFNTSLNLLSNTMFSVDFADPNSDIGT